MISMKKILFFIAVIVIIFSCKIEEIKEFKDIGVIPKPLLVEQQDKIFTLSNEVVLVIESTKKETLFTGKYLQERILLISGINLKVSSNKKETKRTIVLLEKKLENNLNKEAYKLEITEDKIIVIGEDVGLFYGVQTLLQLIQKNKSNTTTDIQIPAYSISDKPRFSWRGMHLDVSRHFFDIEEVKKYIDLMAMYKLNTFHWHLTDDQGWRIEIKSHPELTNKGAWRQGTGNEEWTYFVKPPVEGKPKYGGFYTQEEIKEVIEYAKNRFITIVPEIELPGHSWAALTAYPELSCTGVIWEKPNNVSFEFSDPFCAGNENTFEFFDEVLEEVANLFPSKYIHIGGDEAKKEPWEHCSKCQNRMKVEGLENVEELQSYFIKRIEKIVSSKNKKIIGWEEIMEGGLPKDVVVMSWKGEESGIKAANMGYKVIMNPKQYTYFNRSEDVNFPNSKGVVTLQDVYNYNPISDSLDVKSKKNIIGVQAAIWTELFNTNSQIEKQLMPRMIALSEVAWSPNKNWENFISRLENQFPILDILDVNYHIQSPIGLSKGIYVGERKKIELNIPYKKATIRYTLDGSEPTINSTKYIKEFYATNLDTVKATTFLSSKRYSKTTIGTYKKSKLLKALPITNLKKGLNLNVFSGKITTLNEFYKLKKVKEKIVEKIVIPSDSLLIDYFGLEFKGYINIKEDGIYTFYVSSDDGSQLYIDNNLVVNNDGIHSYITKSGQVVLEKGKHQILVKYFEGNYGEDLKIEMGTEFSKPIEINEFYRK